MTGPANLMPDPQRHVTLVTGAPCSGKSTYVRQHAHPGDVVLDFDIIARQLGSSRRWRHETAIREAAEEIMRARLAAVATAKRGVFWVIRCTPLAQERAALASWLHADRVVVLRPPLSVLMDRALQRPDRRGTVASVRSWVNRWSPAPCDEVIDTLW